MKKCYYGYCLKTICILGLYAKDWISLRLYSYPQYVRVWWCDLEQIISPLWLLLSSLRKSFDSLVSNDPYFHPPLLFLSKTFWIPFMISAGGLLKYSSRKKMVLFVTVLSNNLGKYFGYKSKFQKLFVWNLQNTMLGSKCAHDRPH